MRETRQGSAYKTYYASFRSNLFKLFLSSVASTRFSPRHSQFSNYYFSAHYHACNAFRDFMSSIFQGIDNVFVQLALVCETITNIKIKSSTGLHTGMQSFIKLFTVFLKTCPLDRWTRTEDVFYLPPLGVSKISNSCYCIETSYLHFLFCS